MIVALCLVGVSGSGLMAGVFFAFSAFVMRALNRLPAPEGIAAMRQINVAVLNPVFLGVFVGTALLSAGAITWGLLHASQASAYLIAGGASYVTGTFGVTAAFNVPRNERLARLDPNDPDAARAWSRYVVEWTRWNHVRAVASLAACACFALALTV